jgi:hypothetical protein
MLKAVSLLTGEITQSEFIQRELGISILKISQAEISDVKWERQIPLIVTDKVDECSDFLSKQPAKTVGILLLGNEYYERNRITTLSNFPSVKFVLSENMTSKCPLINLTALGAVFVESPSMVAEKAFYTTLVEASRSAFRSRIRLPFPVLSLPFGYLNRFVGELARIVDIGNRTSLLNRHEYTFENWESRQVDISFFGQKGSWYRRHLITSFEAKTGSVTTTYSSWGGNFSGNPDGKQEFTELLLNSKFVLCPPGNHANETSRYYEAIVTGSIPIISRNTIQDNHIYQYWSSELLPSRISITHNRLYEYVSALGPRQQYELAQKIRSYEIFRLNNLKCNIERFTTHQV